MEIAIVTSKRWRVLQGESNILNKERIEEIIRSINQISSGDYYMLDYFKKRIIVGDSSSPILCGYPQKTADEEGFGFFERILDSTEQNWLNKVNRGAYKIFFSYDETKRKYLRISYNLAVKTINGQKYVLHHKTTPFKLCKNGNMWLGLCHVMIATDEMKNKAQIVNTIDGKKYDLSNGSFVPSNTDILTYIERQILTMMAKGTTASQISDSLRISETAFNRHRRKIFDKLGVDKSTSAVHKAHAEGLI